MSKDTGGPAWPSKIIDGFDIEDTPNGDAHAVPIYKDHSGMTLLDYFACQALAGMLSDNKNLMQLDGAKHTTRTLAAQSYNFAEAMIAEKRKREASRE